MNEPGWVLDKLCVLSRADEDTWPTDPVVDAAIRYLRGDDDVPDAIADVLEAAFHPVRAPVLEALLLAGAEDEDIREILGMEPHICVLYRKLCFDTTQFKDLLDRWAYVKQVLPARVARSNDTTRTRWTDAEQWATWALDNGLVWLRARLNPDARPPSLAMLNRMVNTAYVQFDTASKQRADSARGWAATFLGALRAGASEADRARALEGATSQDWEVVLSTPAESEVNAPSPVTINTADIIT